MTSIMGPLSSTALRPASAILDAKRWASRLAREVALYGQMLQLGRSGAKMVFLPSSGRSGSSLLRAYLVASAMNNLDFRCIVVPPNLRKAQRYRIFDSFKPDLLFVQGGRHVLNDPNYFKNIPYVFDLDDADFENPILQDKLMRLCGQARGVIGGSRYVTDWMKRHNACGTVVWTGTPMTSGASADHHRRAAIVTWAQARPLDYPVEFEFVRNILLELKSIGTDFTFRLYGWQNCDDPSVITSLGQAGIPVELKGPMPYKKFLASLREVSIGLSPVCVSSSYSRGKSFGKILAYIDSYVPVITSDEVDHSMFFTPETGVVTNDPKTWVSAASRLLGDAELRNRMASAARDQMIYRLSTEAAAGLIATFLQKKIFIDKSP